jgi:hypothetical protein
LVLANGDGCVHNNPSQGNVARWELTDFIMTENLLRSTWSQLDQTDLRIFLKERIGVPGQYDGRDDVLHLPLAREKCKLSLVYRSSDIVAIHPGAAFDRSEWESLCKEIETSILIGPEKVGREFSFSSHTVGKSWRGQRRDVPLFVEHCEAVSLSSKSWTRTTITKNLGWTVKDYAYRCR